ncbi:MAG: SlyX family protein [Granulosicoccus sp.]|nr:SlyX family protein [Granulosicoccus sp.]
MNDESRLSRLEMLVTEQELLLEQYSDLIRDQQKQLDQLSHKIEMLELKLSKYQQPDEYDSSDQVPPHY